MERVYETFSKFWGAAATLNSEEKFSSSIANFLYDWQTLITGLVALVGAVLLWVQISDQRKEAAAARKQQEIIARMRLPYALSTISDYLSSCYEAWKAKDLKLKSPAPSDAINLVTNVAPFAEPETVKTLLELVVNFQAFEARLRNQGGAAVNNLFEVMIADMGRLRELVDMLFAYGRLEEERVAFKRQTRQATLWQIEHNLATIVDVHQPAIRQRIQDAMNMRFGKP